MPCTVELVCIPPSRVQEIWPHVEPLLRAATERTGLAAFAPLENDILHGNGLVWVAWSGRVEAAASTALQVTDAGLVCLITACGAPEGDMQRWLPLLSQIEDYARAEGCRCIRIVGRRGWQKVLPDYIEKHVILDRIL